ncbi:unnamed protein product [Periconia digitata]|uniref:Uncharacterized protein n=1 Tax=Periconia digitata TaxID=1303443 RepID=A0A9W4U4G1_9PLEO|nr:unnamed protein product [Periconia digitata]
MVPNLNITNPYISTGSLERRIRHYVKCAQYVCEASSRSLMNAAREQFYAGKKHLYRRQIGCKFVLAVWAGPKQRRSL